VAAYRFESGILRAESPRDDRYAAA